MATGGEEGSQAAAGRTSFTGRVTVAGTGPKCGDFMSSSFANGRRLLLSESSIFCSINNMYALTRHIGIKRHPNLYRTASTSNGQSLQSTAAHYSRFSSLGQARRGFTAAVALEMDGI